MSSRFLYFSMVVILHFSNGVYGKAAKIDTETIVGAKNVTSSLDNAVVSEGLENLSYAEGDNVKEPNASTMALPPPGDGGGDNPSEGGPSSEFIFNRIPTKFSVDASTTDLLGERIDFNNGNVSFNHTDLVAKGNGPTITVSRTLRGYAFSPHRQAYFGDWSLDIPAIHTTLVRSTTRYSGAWGLGRACSGPIAPGPIYNRGISYNENEYWNGDKLVLPSGNSEELLENTRGYLVDDNEYTRVTKSNWKFSCIDVAGVGEGFKGVSPEGLTYTFSKYRLIPGRLLGNIQRYNAFMLVTKVEDRFGNSVNYNYTGDKLSSISASDGRRVSFSYGTGDEAGFVKSVSYNSRTWDYSYTGSSLKKVTRPDGKSWKYDIAKYVNTVMRSWDSENCTYSINAFVPDFSGTVTHPDGVTGTFTFSGQHHGRSNVKIMKVHERKDDYFTCHDYLNYALKSKTLSGPGISEKTWDYRYSGNWGTWSTETPEPVHLLKGSRPPSVDAENHKSTTVNSPDGSKTVYFYNRDFTSYKEGSLIARDSYDTDGSTLLSREEFSYSKGDSLGFTGTMFENNEPSTIRVNLAKTKVTTNGNTFTTSKSSYDKYGYPLLTTESNNYKSSKRYTKNYFYHETSNWLIGLPSRTLVSSNGSSYKETQKTTYHSASGAYKSLPNYHYAYGRWYKRNESYHTSGSQKGLPKVVRHNGTNRWIEFSNYKRGIAQTIRTPQSLSTSSQYAYRVVDNNGWVTKKTDFLGECITYSHDSMGRTDLVSPCNSSWYDTSISYSTTTSNEGFSYLSAGYLKQTVTKGNYEKITYFDGLLRPIVSRERDKSISSSKRYTRQGYDAFNRLTYQSKPHSLHSTPYGVVNQYDGLGRLIKADDNTTSGSISYSYLSDNRVQVNDNEGNTTTTSFLAYGSPEQSVATQISAPHGVITTLNYNIYGNVTSINQGGLTEYRAYDTYQQLCKTVRNDIGRSAYVYDAIGQLSWTASGDSVSTSTTSCDTNVYNSEKTTLSYDNLGNVRKVEYGDGSSSKLFTYDKNSNLKELVHGDVTQNYDYNDLNLLTSERLRVDSVDWTVSYAYDDYGNKLNVRYPSGGRLWYNPNALGQPKNVGSFASNISFHANGQYKSIKLKNGCINSLSLYNSGLPKVQRSVCGSNNIVYNQYTYDANGNITYWDDKQSNTYDLRFTYDGLDRLDNIRNGGNSLIGDLNYDTMGNITKLDSIAGTINYSYNSSKRLQSTSGMRGYDFSYDDRGNVTNNGFNNFTYNLANEMVNANGNSYVYDGHGKRVKASDSEGTRYSFYSMFGQIIYEKINGSNRENYYLGSQLVAHQGAGAITFIHPDVLGTSAGKTDSGGNLVKRVRYAPFGLEWGKTNASSGENEIGYTGHKHDKSIGLTYMQARYYDPVIGRFYSNDPVDVLGHMGRGNPIHGFNRYAYANNNPYKYTDPDGEFAIQLAATLIGAAIGGATEYLTNPDATLASVGRSALVGGAVGLATSIPGMGTMATMAMGAGANATGEMVNQIATGDYDAGKVLTAGGTGLVGGAVAKAGAKLLTPARALPNNTATQAGNNMTQSSSQRVLEGSKSFSGTAGNRATAEVQIGAGYGAGSAGGVAAAEQVCDSSDSC